MKKNCLNCYYFSYSDGSLGYSEHTPGELPMLQCDKGHFEFDGLTWNGMFLTMENSENCVDYINEDNPE